MKTACRIIASAFLAPVITITVLVITGLFEIIIMNTFLPWILEIAICIAIIPLLIKIERKYIPSYWMLACNGAYFITGVMFVYFILQDFVSLYMSKYYSLLNSWDETTFLKSSQWILYYFTIFAQLGLHLIIRIISAATEKPNKNNKEQ